ncbi:ASCH domain-containing protein [Anabaena sp. CCY 9402-a]|uniref:ASCH domain-containing protein n=1 Tax=Anabaena sp. CCY 9402-a TaxID=3103867 RepID=UPI0039C6FB5F
MNLMSPNILLLSIHQKYANMIFDGDKQVELRRVRPRHLKEGDLILVYVTSPEQALVGVLEVEKVIEKSPLDLWNIVGDKAGITYDCFQQYYRKCSIGYAIYFKSKFSFDSPIKLERLREEWSDFRPPQCYHYLKDREINFVQSIVKQDILSFSTNPKVYQTELLAQN